MITVSRAEVSSYFVIYECRGIAYCIIQVFCSCILCLVCCLVYPTCLGYTAFLTGGIYAQSIQSAQIEFSAQYTTNALHVVT